MAIIHCKCTECNHEFDTNNIALVPNLEGVVVEHMYFCCCDCYEKYYERKRLLEYRKEKILEIKKCYG